MIRKKHDNRGDLYGKEMNPVVTFKYREIKFRKI